MIYIIVESSFQIQETLKAIKNEIFPYEYSLKILIAKLQFFINEYTNKYFLTSTAKGN